MLDSKEASLEPLVTMNLKPEMEISTYLLNAPIKRHRVIEWIKKNKTHLYAAYKRLI